MPRIALLVAAVRAAAAQPPSLGRLAAARGLLLGAELTEGVLNMQKSSRGHILRAEHKLRAKHATALQKHMRVFVAQSVYDRQRTAITKVQFRARMAVAKKRIRRQQRSAVRIQAIVRGASSRTRAVDEKSAFSVRDDRLLRALIHHGHPAGVEDERGKPEPALLHDSCSSVSSTSVREFGTTRAR